MQQYVILRSINMNEGEGRQEYNGFSKSLGTPVPQEVLIEDR